MLPNVREWKMTRRHGCYDDDRILECTRMRYLFASVDPLEADAANISVEMSICAGKDVTVIVFFKIWVKFYVKPKTKRRTKRSQTTNDKEREKERNVSQSVSQSINILL